MLNFRVSVTLFLLVVGSCQWLAANPPKGYFVRLTPNGIANKENILAGKWSDVLSSTKPEINASFTSFEAIQSRPKSLRLNRWLVVKSPQNTNNHLLNTLQEEGYIDWVEEIGYFKLNEIDYQAAEEQWYLNKISAAKAWNIAVGNEDVIVAIIDTGIDYFHSDIESAIWRNKAEMNGVSGVDDDGNGFVDDSLGWDFTDAPRFADGGDYSERDNDPMDEFGAGHGTPIAGIIAGQNANRILGISPGVKIMNLRAGTASGYLEEDDVADAIIYAVENGASIINMSFGDAAISTFLKDVIRFAYNEGVILVASAGNSANDQLHFPSGLRETIAVGASTQNDHLASFSSFGNTIELVAPGSHIYSAAIGGRYGFVNGTSFSAPMVSAVAGLLLSVNANLTIEQIKNILKTSTDDILNTGWDYFSGSGRLNAEKALLAADIKGRFQLNHPYPESSVSENFIMINATALHPNLMDLEISWGAGRQPASWQLIEKIEYRQILNENIGGIDASLLPDTIITIKLKANLTDHSAAESRFNFYIDKTPPQITQQSQIPMLYNDLQANLIAFKTDDICKSKLLIDDSDAFTNPQEVFLDYETTDHKIILKEDRFSGNYFFKIYLKNEAGLEIIDDNEGRLYQFTIENNFYDAQMNLLDRFMPAGYIFPKSVDLDNDGNKEIMISRYGENFSFGPIEIYEYDDGEFLKRWQSSFTAIPRDAGDFNGDGKSEILLSYGKLNYILTSNAHNAYPNDIVWRDSSSFWAASFQNNTSSSNYLLSGKVENSYKIIQTNGKTDHHIIASLKNSTSGENYLGVPYTLNLDVDEDDKEEFIYGDEDGDILAWNNEDFENFTLLSKYRTIRDGQAIIGGYSNAGEAILCAASFTKEDINSEHQLDGRFRSVEKLKYNTSSGSFVQNDALNIYGYFSEKEFDSGMQMSAIQGADYLFLSFYPNLYLVKIANDTFEPAWYYPQCRSNTVVVEDFDGNGVEEFYFNNGVNIIGFEPSAISAGPFNIQHFRVAEVDSSSAALEWVVNKPNRIFHLFRQSPGEDSVQITTTQNTFYTDTTLNIHQNYTYWLQVNDSASGNIITTKSERVKVYTDYPPKMIGLKPVDNRQLIAKFDQQLLKENRDMYFTLTKSGERSRSARLMSESKNVLISFDTGGRQNEADTLVAHNVYNELKIKVDQKFNRLEFVFIEKDKPYVKSWELMSRYQVNIEFSESMEKGSLENLDNYAVYPVGTVTSVQILDDAHQKIQVRLSKNSMAGSLGKAAYIQLNHIKNKNGAAIEEGSKINLNRDKTNLEEMVVYPQPLKPGQNKIMFANLPQAVEINIFTIGGLLLKNISGRSEYGGVVWDLRDKRGKEVGSGVYIYEVQYNGKRKIGKLAVVR
jgi:subtilisin family serine protease